MKTIKSKILIISLILIILCSFQAVSALDDNNIISDNIPLSVQEDNVLTEVNDHSCNNVLRAGSEDYGSLSDLKALIDNDPTGNLVLDKDYKFNPETDTGEKSNSGISIGKKITIDGNGHTLDGLNQSRLFSISKNNVCLKNINFVNGYFPASGGAIWCSGSNCLIDNCTFENCNSPGSSSSNGQGGAIYFQRSSNDIINNSKFYSNSANYGGTIYSIYGGNLRILNSEFDSNVANFHGGAIELVTSGVTINNCTFRNNSCHKYYGGAVSSDKNCRNNKILNCAFINNSAINNGGALYYPNSGGQLINLTFINNSAIDQNKPDEKFADLIAGGAAYISGNRNLIQNIVIINNSAELAGGIALVASSDNLLQNITFVNNTATRFSAGGLAILDANSGKKILYSIENAVFDCEFINNTAGASGAGLFMQGKGTYVNNTYFFNNHAGYAGGALLDEGVGSIIDYCIIVNNTAKNYGGGISLNNSSLSNSLIENNVANLGGGVYSAYGTLTKLVFKGNNATYKNESNPEIIYGNSIFVLNQTNIVDCEVNLRDIYYYNKSKVEVGSLSGPSNVLPVPEGYWGYCIERNHWQTKSGFLDDSLKLVRNVLSDEEVGEYIKILIYENINSIDDIFDLNKSLQESIWEFTDYDFRNSDNPLVQRAIKVYESGLRIPTKNATKILPNGTLLTFNFTSLISPTSEQNLFLFNVTEIKNNQGMDKKAVNNTYNAGEKAEFIITVNNTSNHALKDVFIEDIDYSDELEYDSWDNVTGKWSYIKNETGRYWYLKSLDVGKNASIIVKFVVKTNGTFYNNASSWSKGINKTWTYDIIEAHNPNMTVEKLTLNKTVYIGNQTMFKIIVTNNGDVNLTNIEVKETEYDGLKLIDFKADAPWLGNVKTGEFLYKGVLHPGENASFIVIFNTFKEGNFTNVVVGYNNKTGNKTANNTTEVLKPLTFKVTKEWNDDNNRDGVRPESVTVELRADGEVVKTLTITSDDNWTAIFTGLPIYRDNTQIPFNYTITEVSVANYTLEDITRNNNSFNIKNNHTPAVTCINVTKVWSDNNNQDGLRPDSVIVELLAEGVVIKNVTLSNENSWKHSFTDLPVNKDGKKIKYTVNEIPVDNYTVNITGSNGIFVINNTHKHVFKPGMSVRKIALNKLVYLGQQVKFVIVVANTGDCDLTGVYVIDNDFTEGIIFDHMMANDEWTFDGKDKFTYGKILGVGESANFTIVFNTTSVGFKVNNVTAGNNITNETVNSTNNTTVINNTVPPKPEPPEPKPPQPVHPQHPIPEVPNVSDEENIPDKHTTGNPIFVLIPVLFTLFINRFRRRKQ